MIQVWDLPSQQYGVVYIDLNTPYAALIPALGRSEVLQRCEFSSTPYSDYNIQYYKDNMLRERQGSQCKNRIGVS